MGVVDKFLRSMQFSDEDYEDDFEEEEDEVIEPRRNSRFSRDAEEDEEGHIAHILHGDDAGPQSDECLLHLIIYRELSQNEPDKAHGCQAADDRHPPSGGCELS